MKNLIGFLLGLFLIPAAVLPQELRQFKVREETRPASIPVFTQFPNDAAVIIYSSIPQISFESNTEGILANKSVDGESKYTLILRTETQTLTVKSPGFIEAKIKIQRMQPKDVKYFSIEASARSFDPEKGDLVLKTVPAGARILIDGMPEFDHFTPFSLTGFEAKTYKITLVKEDYDTVRITAEIKKGEKISKVAEMTPRFGLIDLQTAPDNEFRVDQVLMPFEPGVPVRVPVGKHSLSLSKPRYIPVSQQVEIGPNDNPLLAVPFKATLIPDFGTWTFKVTPSGAKVYIDDKVTDITGGPVEIQSGKRMFRVYRSGYDDTTFTESIRRLENRVVAIDLRRQTGKLYVTSDPDEASVFLGDSLIGYTPFVNEAVPTGVYELSIRKDRYQTVVFPVNLRRGETVTRSADLQTQGRLTVTGTNGATFKVFSRNNSPVEFEGTIPLISKKLPPGPYTIYFTYPGYEKESMNFTISDQDEILNFDLTQTDGKFFRFTAFGNTRIYNLYNDRTGLGFTWARQIFTKKMMSELTGKKVDSHQLESYNVEIPYEAAPFRLVLGYGINAKKSLYAAYSPVTESGEKVDGSLRFENYFLTFSYTPFVLAERFSPSVGFRMEKLDMYFRNNLTSERKKKSVTNGSLSFDLNFYLQNHGATPFLKVSYLPYEGNNWSEARTSIHFGILF
ncbi:MAG: PEGA domain-containing protein [Bacteroidetes bacterium]|nr:PEGA domain-containing protein [Bacteroidota bacterium]